MADWKVIGGITALGGIIGFFGAKTVDSRKLPAGEKAVLTGASTGATMEGIEALMAAENKCCNSCPNISNQPIVVNCDECDGDICADCEGETICSICMQNVCHSCSGSPHKQCAKWANGDDNRNEQEIQAGLLGRAESFSAEKEKRSKYMEFIYDMFYTPGSDAYKIREERVLPRNDSTYRLASQVGIAFDKRQRPFDSVLHNNLKGLSMGGGNTYYYIIPYKGELFVFSYIVKGRGRYKRGYHTYYTPDSQFGEEQICGIETKHGDDCYCYRKNYKAESHDFSQKSAESFSADSDYDMLMEDYRGMEDYVQKMWNFIDNKIGYTYFISDDDTEEVKRFRKDLSEHMGEKYIEQEFNAESFSAETVVDCSNFTDDMRHHDWNVVDVYSHNGGELHSFEMVCQKCGNKAVLKPEEGLIAFAHYKGANSYPTYPDFIKLSAESFSAGQKGYKQVTSRME